MTGTKHQVHPQLRQIPGVDEWLNGSHAKELLTDYARKPVAAALRDELVATRNALIADPQSSSKELAIDFASAEFTNRVRTRLEAVDRSEINSVINATGVILHTNLGRAPMARQAVAAAENAANDYSNLEFNLNTGKRGSRQQLLEPLIKAVTGADAALVVNNCAAALHLVLSVCAASGETVISRGELIEIGGSFRMPDVIAASGSRMIEVGTTNRTTLTDYESAMSLQTRVVLASHPSNFKISGFTAKPTLSELVTLASRHDCLSVLDLGSGCLVDLESVGCHDEPTVQQCLRSGVDLITFSGDKLLGGPQAGIIVGRGDLIKKLASHALARAMRLDKLSVAALAATLKLYLDPFDPFEQIPVLRMIAESKSALEERTRAFVTTLGALLNSKENPLTVDVLKTTAVMGGGTLPGHELPSVGIRLRHSRLSPNTLAKSLRQAKTPVIARVQDNAVWIDLRTVLPNQLEQLAATLKTSIATNSIKPS